MYIYQIGYFSYEECPQRYLIHDVKFDADEFRQLVLLAVEAVVREWLAKPLDSASWLTQYESIVHEDIAEWMIRERGFRDVEVTARENFSGWSPLFPGKEKDEDDERPINKAATARLIELGLEDSIHAKNEAVQAFWTTEPENANDDK